MSLLYSNNNKDSKVKIIKKEEERLGLIRVDTLICLINLWVFILFFFFSLKKGKCAKCYSAYRKSQKPNNYKSNVEKFFKIIYFFFF